MIHVLYDHGDERPAAGLTVAQIRAARSDPAGVLWADLEAPSAAERASLLGQAFGLPPATDDLLLELGGAVVPLALPGCALVPLRSSAAHAPSPGTVATPAAGILGLYLGANFVITLHADPWPLLATLRDSVASGNASMSHGASQLAADILSLIVRHDRQVTDAAAAALERLGQRRGDAATLAQLATVRGQLAALRREVRQQRQAALWLAVDAGSPVAATGRTAFGLLAQALASQAERIEDLLAAATRLAEQQRLHLQWQTARWLRIIALLLVALSMTAWAVAASVFALWR